MLRKIVLAMALLATFAVAGLVTPERAEARGPWRMRRPAWNVYYYYNGPEKPFFGPPIRIYSNAYDIGPYGPGYGWPFARPVEARFYVGF
jgi:hypothetical protein